LIAEIVVKDMQPFSTVENKGSQNMNHSTPCLADRFLVISIRHIQVNPTTSAKQFLFFSHASVMTDIWTSLKNTTFMTFINLYFNRKQNFQSSVLAMMMATVLKNTFRLKYRDQRRYHIS